MVFRILAFCAGGMLTLGIGPSTVLGQGPITPDPRLQERTTDGEYRTGTKFVWGSERDCWARMMMAELGLVDLVLPELEDEEDERARKEKEREEALKEEDEFRQRQLKAWNENNEGLKRMGLPPSDDFEKGFKVTLEEWRKRRAAKRSEPTGSEPKPTSKSESPESCLTHTTQSEIEVDEFLKIRAAIRKQADALLHSNDPTLMKAGRELSIMAEQVQPPEAGTPPPPPPPDPLSFWIHGRPPGGAGNPGPGLVLDVASVATFRDAGVTLLSNTWSSPRAWPGSVYAERDQPRTVAPAPSLDPAHWPATEAPVVSLSLEEPAQ